MRIAVTGGSGFIGTRLVEDLKEKGHDPIILDIEASEAFPDSTHIVDVRDRDLLSESLKDVDAVYHLAAEHFDNVEPVSLYHDVNVRGAENLVAAAQAKGLQTIIFTSTVALYGLEGGVSSEDDPLEPFNDYGKSKLAAETIFRRWAEGDPGRRLVILRLTAIFGEGNRGNVYTLISQIHQRRFMMVGRGLNTKSIAYVGNLIRFLAFCLTLPAGVHVYNYADKPDLSTRELVRIIRENLGMPGIGPSIPYVVGLTGGALFDLLARLSGKKLPISAIRVRKFCANTIIDARKVEGTGFQPSYSLEDGLRRTIAHEFGGSSHGS